MNCLSIVPNNWGFFLSKHPSLCELFYIQVQWMFTETLSLTSTLHHNTFSYMAYVFLLPSYCQIFIHIYFHTVLS